MSKTLGRGSEALDRAFAADRLCDEFEAAWKAGRRPRIEDYLARVERAARPALLGWLLELEADYRREAGEPPTTGEYAGRFPEYPAVVAAVLPPPEQAPTADLSHALTGEPEAGTTGGPWPAIPGYEVLAELGEGGMGRVYKALDLKLDRVVALKLIRCEVVRPAQRELFLAEGRAIARLQHPHIVHIQKVDEAGGLPFLELEYMGGGSLAEKIGDAPQPPRDAALLVEQIANAVAHAHARGVIHRDLKPANVLLTEAGEPKIADFGLATTADRGEVQRNGIAGTFQYMAPEQARGDGENVGPPADVYALGGILFKLLTGRVPFTALKRGDLLRQVREESPPPPRSLNRGVPKALEAICLKCLRKDPADRYATAGALADALGDYLRGPLGRLWRRCRRNPVVTVASAAVFLASAVAGLMFFDASLIQVRRAGELVVGIDPNCPPYSSWNGATPSGIDVEVARGVAKRMGVEPVFRKVYFDWPDMVKQLEERKIDVLVSCVTVTPEREREVAFVEYARDPLVFTARKGHEVHTREHLRGKVVAVQTGTSAHDSARRLRSAVEFSVRGFPTVPDPFAAVRRGDAHVALDHGRIARHHARLEAPELAVLQPDGIDSDLADQRLGIALRRGAGALRAAVAEAVEGMRRDGSLDEMLRDRHRP